MTADKKKLFYIPEVFLYDKPLDYRWDLEKNAKLLNIVFLGGTYGHFLKFFLSKFSKLTPDITFSPFTDIGTTHRIKPEEQSRLIQKYHFSFINDNIGEINLPVCLIKINHTVKDALFMEASRFFRGGDRKIVQDVLYNEQELYEEGQKSFKPLKELFKTYKENICSLYKINLTKDSKIPKFIVRDWYKLLFLDGNIEDKSWHSEICQLANSFTFFDEQKTYYFPLESFYDFETFIKNIKELDSYHCLKLDFDRMTEMKDCFLQGYNLDKHRQQLNLVFDVIDNLKTEKNMIIPNLFVLYEAFLYAHIEKTNPEIPAPLTNHFFKDTNEIREYVKNYPNWYKRPNPNLKNGQK